VALTGASGGLGKLAAGWARSCQVIGHGRAVPVPVNCIAHPVRHTLERFARLGVGRITYGPLLQAALTGMISNWT
jgi:2-methylisocitrate lyase-like PEP mutase family enzyme